jgi:hypothetical protein
VDVADPPGPVAVTVHAADPTFAGLIGITALPLGTGIVPEASTVPEHVYDSDVALVEMALMVTLAPSLTGFGEAVAVTVGVLPVTVSAVVAVDVSPVIDVAVTVHVVTPTHGAPSENGVEELPTPRLPLGLCAPVQE